MIIRLHPDYVSSLAKWNTIDDFVDGDSSLVSKYLVPHASESANNGDARAAWASRLRRFENENELEPILVVWQSHLGQEVNFGEMTNDPNMSAVLADVTGEECSAQDAFKERMALLLKHGICGTLVDAPESESRSQLTDRDPTFRSYQTIFRAQEILSYSRFKKGPRRGSLSTLLLSLGMEDDSGGEYERLVYFSYPPDASADTPYQIQYLKRGKDVQIRDGALDLEPLDAPRPGVRADIPFVLIGRGLLKDSIMRMPAQYSRKLMNQISAKENVEYHQGFVRTIVTGTTGEELKTMSEATIACINNDGKNVSVHQIEPGDTTSIRDTINDGRTRIRRYGMRFMNQMVADNSAQVQSAESKAGDLKSFIAGLNDILNLMTRKEVQIYRLHAEFEGFDPDAVSIAIARNFGLDDPSAVQSQRGAAFNRFGQLGFRAGQKQIAKQDLQDIGELVPDEGDQTGAATRAKLMADIDQIPDEDPLAVPLGEPGARDRNPLRDLQ